jgi:hypothetical protein
MCKTAFGITLGLNIWAAAANASAAEKPSVFSTADIEVEDAYVCKGRSDSEVAIGTRSVEWVFSARDGQFRLVSFKNKLCAPAREYVDPEAALAPLASALFQKTSADFNAWTVTSVAAKEASAGGRPAAELEVSLDRPALSLRATMRLTAYPRTSVIRQRVEFENSGTGDLTLETGVPFCVGLKSADLSEFKQLTLVGANCRPDQGTIREEDLTGTFHHALKGNGTRELVPWTSLQRKAGERDGWFVLLDQEGPWGVAADCEGNGVPVLSVTSFGGTLKPGERFALPLVTAGTYKGSLDDMGQRVYGWFYEYQWDYTHHDWFARTLHLDRFNPYWSDAVWNVQEKFASRLAMVLNTALVAQGIGEETLWDDIAWWASPATVPAYYEGPDFARTSRFLAKADMKFIGYFSGAPHSPVLNAKVGAEGNYQWRTDMCAWGRGNRGSVTPEQVKTFLNEHPRCSFHSCSGGGGYNHGFEVQRLGDVNQMSDHSPEQSNYCFSYLEIPDKWQNTFGAGEGAGGRFDASIHRRILSHVPSWYAIPGSESQEAVRQTVEIYHYLIRKGVAGRWSYLFHPSVQGDQALFYVQRTSYDRERACVVLKHTATNDVTVFPCNLLSKHAYTVGFASKKETTTRSGKDLMENGIMLAKQAPGELIYLGLPDRPGGGLDKTVPAPPLRVIARQEANVGLTGVSLYWSPGADDQGIGYYEVKRGDEILGKASTHTYYFDCSQGCDPQARYAVRTVDGDGNASDWKPADRFQGEPWEADALGGLYPQQGQNGWGAETTTDGVTFQAMKWTAQRLEGCWTGADTARVGRGWQQTDVSAQCVRAWTASRAGPVRVIGRAMKEFRHRYGTALRVKILHNAKQVWPAEGWAEARENDLTGCSHDVRLELQKGDTLRFVLDKGGSPKDEILAWMPRIVYEEKSGATASPCVVVRIACGSKKTYTDAQGNVWSADTCFSGGRAVKTTKGTVRDAQPMAGDEELYLRGREGRSFSYSIPVTPGLYSLRLKFAEMKYAWFFQRPFNLDINGRRVLSNFDVCQAAGGFGKAYEKVFRYLVPDGDGRLVLNFSGGWEPAQKSNEAIVQAIEILPELKPTVRIRCGSPTDYIDWNSFVWSADAFFEGGTALASPKPEKPAGPVPVEKLKVTGSESCSPGVGETGDDPGFVLYATPTLYDQALYRSGRTGRSFRYVVPVPPGLYTVHLKFAELWLGESGKRPMNIEVNGRRMGTHWDPATASGGVRAAADLRIEDVVPDKDGRLAIQVVATGENDAVLQAIEIE